jgi:hypothetical protein
MTPMTVGTVSCLYGCKVRSLVLQEILQLRTKHWASERVAVTHKVMLRTSSLRHII